ncbi:hypothetical protein TSAR_009299 [Trichomalopsis sarcophagae]|uniref:Uncharacterized protein n=1 Tax=Trichomalopsis sarcophagae TaxID=543379 RepID=A0A232FF87_9HYME|nr:hypothetical protein TSAR_009299 [Trichomalopsis sarcophagae]
MQQLDLLIQEIESIDDYLGPTFREPLPERVEARRFGSSQTETALIYDQLTHMRTGRGMYLSPRLLRRSTL